MSSRGTPNLLDANAHLGICDHTDPPVLSILTTAVPGCRASVVTACAGGGLEALWSSSGASNLVLASPSQLVACLVEYDGSPHMTTKEASYNWFRLLRCFG